MAKHRAPISSVSMTYTEAVMYCFCLEYNGMKGWRLPTHAEYINCNYPVGWEQEDEVSAHEIGPYHVLPVRD